MQDRRYIFGILLSNSVIDGKKCLFSLAKPFCEISRNQGKSSWLECVSVSRTRDILDLLTVGRNIQNILDKYPV